MPFAVDAYLNGFFFFLLGILFLLYVGGCEYVAITSTIRRMLCDFASVRELGDRSESNPVT